MKENKTDKNLLLKGIQKMALSVLFMFLGPTLIYVAFSNTEKPLYIPILFFAIVFCGLAIYLSFKGIKLIIDIIFNTNSN